MKYLCKIRFVGSGFCGFQTQPGVRTVQGTLTAVASQLFGCPCLVTGCSRTDSGVHANMFCVTLEPTASVNIPPKALPKALATLLPEDLACMEAVQVPEEFHPRYAAKGKEYLYLVDNGPVADPFLRDRAYHVPYPLKEEALAKMNVAADLLKGTHDFSSFMAAGSKITDAVRTVTHFSVRRNGDLLEFRVAADGFLYHMVRILVGTLLEVGRGVRPAESMPEILAAKDRKSAGATAPSAGLYLDRVFYE